MTSIHRITHLRARLVEHDWPWARANKDRIAAHWERRRGSQPALFNGRVLMVAGAALADDRLELEMFETGYAPFLAHIDFGFPDPSVRNGFAMGALRSRDGAFLLGRMAPHTSQAGRIYFPAGTPDRGDVRPDGTVDLAGSLLREIGEETGLVLDPGVVSPDWTLVRHGGRDALMRGVQLDRDADDVRAGIMAHLARDPQPELSDIVTVRGPGDMGQDGIDQGAMPDFLRAYLAWRFAGSDQR